MGCVHRHAEKTDTRYGGVRCEDPEFGWKCPDCGTEFMETEQETRERLAAMDDDEIAEDAQAILDATGGE